MTCLFLVCGSLFLLLLGLLLVQWLKLKQIFQPFSHNLCKFHLSFSVTQAGLAEIAFRAVASLSTNVKNVLKQGLLIAKLDQLLQTYLFKIRHDIFQDLYLKHCAFPLLFLQLSRKGFGRAEYQSFLISLKHF